MKKLISLLLIFIMILSTAAFGTAASGEGAAMERAEYPLYFRNAEDVRSIRLYFEDTDREIPYIYTDSMRELLEAIYHEENRDQGFALTVTAEGHTARFTRENGAEMEIDCEADTIRFTDFDSFFMPSNLPVIIDMLEHYGTIQTLRVIEENCYSSTGVPVCFELAKYGISLTAQDGICCICQRI